MATDETVWYCALMVQVGVQATGNLEDANEQVNKLAAHLELHCKEVGISFVRGKQAVRRRDPIIDNGGLGGEDEQTNSESAEELLEQSPQ